VQISESVRLFFLFSAFLGKLSFNKIKGVEVSSLSLFVLVLLQVQRLERLNIGDICFNP